MNIKKFNESFNNDERDLFEDLLQEYIDKYNMMEMLEDPSDQWGKGFYLDRDTPRIQYLVQKRFSNISIYIESNWDISLDEVFLDMKTSFIPRVERYGYTINCELDKYKLQSSISITIMKKD